MKVCVRGDAQECRAVDVTSHRKSQIIETQHRVISLIERQRNDATIEGIQCLKAPCRFHPMHFKIKW